MNSVREHFEASIKLLDKSVRSLSMIVGVSGGLDSIVLMHLLKSAGFNPIIAHVNYKLRGGESDADADLVAAKAKILRFQFELMEADPVKLQAGNFQDNARKYRYAFFDQLRVKYNAGLVVTAHHRDDQLETMLLKIFRGAGLDAISGMSVLDMQQGYFRPLLQLSKEQILDYAREQQLEWREDNSNEKSDYARNWLRNLFLPEVSERLPGWQDNLIRMGEKSANLANLLDWLASANSIDGNELEINRFKDLDVGAFKLVAHSWLKKCGVTPSAGELEMVVRLLKSEPGTLIRFGSGECVIRERDSLYYENKDNAESPLTESNVAIIHKSDIGDVQFTSFARQNLRLDIRMGELVKPIEKKKLTEESVVKASGQSAKEFKMEGTLRIQSDALRWPVKIGLWQSSDRLQPLGMNGTMLVSDVLTNRKIRSSQKKHAITITSFDGKICAIIFPHPDGMRQCGCIDQHFRITSETREFIEIKVQYT